MVVHNCDEIPPTDWSNLTSEPTSSPENGTLGYDVILSEHLDYKISLALYTFLLPVIVVFGTIGNLLSFAVMRRKKLRHNATCFYLAVLAIGDTLVLYISGARYWVGKIGGVDIKMLNDLSCKLIGGYLYHFSRHFSVWIVVAMTIDRCAAVSFPLRTRSLATVRHARLATIIIAITLSLVDGILIYAYELVYDCVFRDSSMTLQARCYTAVLRTVWPWIDLSLYSFVPVTLLVALNTRLMYSLLGSDKQRKRMVSISGKAPVTPSPMSYRRSRNQNISRHSSLQHDITSENQLLQRLRVSQSNIRRLNNEAFDIATNGAPNNFDTVTQSTNSRHSKRRKSVGKEKHVNTFTLLPLIISIPFIICTTPITVIELFYSQSDKLDNTDYVATLRLIRTVFFMLMYLNHSFNFLLYCVSGATFRNELTKMLNCKIKRNRLARSLTISSLFTHSHGTLAVGESSGVTRGTMLDVETRSSIQLQTLNSINLKNSHIC